MPRRKKNENESADLQKAIRTSGINAAVDELIRKGEANKDGRIPQGTMRRVLLDLKKSGIETDRFHLNYERKKRMKMMTEEEERPPVEEIDIASEDVSSFTNSNNSGNRTRGRPCGSTIVCTAEAKQARIECINEIAELYAKEIEDSVIVANHFLTN
jgi:hypothetical protein